MQQKIDFKKMMDQEPEFDKFVREVLVDVMLADPNIQGMLQAIHAFYQVGNTADQTVQIIRTMTKYSQ